MAPKGTYTYDYPRPALTADCVIFSHDANGELSVPRFRGETPYRQSVFEFSLHIEHESGVCDKIRDNYIFLNLENYDDEREALAKAIVDYFAFDEDGKLIGTMLAQNTSYEKTRLTELADLFPQYGKKLLAICDKSADLIHLLKTNEAFYSADDAPDSVKKNAPRSSIITMKTLAAVIPSRRLCLCLCRLSHIAVWTLATVCRPTLPI